mgnify:CR=1 FL=1|jgi:hypothetical protein
MKAERCEDLERWLLFHTGSAGTKLLLVEVG